MAVDTARIVLRLGAEQVKIIDENVTLKSARQDEVEHAIEEGIGILNLTGPAKIFADENGYVNGIECIKYKQDFSDGRLKVVPIDGSEFSIDADAVFTTPITIPPLSFDNGPAEIKNRNSLMVEGLDGKTLIQGIFVTGGLLIGSSTIAEAMKSGKMTAQAIHKYLNEFVE